MLFVCVLAVLSCGRYLSVFELACIEEYASCLCASDAVLWKIPVYLWDFARLEEYTVQFASDQDGIYALGKSHIRATQSLWRFPNVAFDTVRLTDDGPFSSFQRISLSVSAFHAALLQATGGVMLSTLSPQVVFQAPQHIRSSGTQATCDSCKCPASLYTRSFPSTPACPGL